MTEARAIGILEAAGLSWNSGGHGQDAFTLDVPRARLNAGSRVAVCGPSGCGKSTLLGLLSLALRPARVDRLVFGGFDAAALWSVGDVEALTALRSRSIGFVPQTNGLLTFLTIGENMQLQQEILGRPDRNKVVQLGEQLGIASLLRRRPSEVSVGQRQRAAIARALAHSPIVVLADEPTSALHGTGADDVLCLLAAAAAEGAAVLIATHDPERARRAGFEIATCSIEASRATTSISFGG